MTSALPLNPIRDYFRPFEMNLELKIENASYWSSATASLVLLIIQVAVQTILFCLLMLIPVWGFSFAQNHLRLVYSSSEGSAAYGGIALLAVYNLVLYCAGLAKGLIRTWNRF